MADIMLSEAEKRFIVDAVKLDFRVDGRQRLDYRQLIIETGLVSTANGSSRTRLSRTDVLVTVKMEIEPPSPEQLHNGKLNFFVNCSANAAPEFEGRGGEDLATGISELLDRLYSSPLTFDTSKLCIVPGKHVKSFYVDVEILECGGNLYDTISIGVKAALFSTRTPKIRVTGEDGGELEFAVSDNPNDVDRVDVSNAPLLVTHLRITENVTVVDPTPEEECCGPVSLVVGVTPTGAVTASQLIGSGTFTPQTLLSCIKSATEIGIKTHAALIKKLMEEERMSERRIRGFLLE